MLHIYKNVRFSIEFVLLYGILSIFCNFIVSAKTCTKTTSCACTTDSGHLIDLKSLANTDGTPAYKDVADPTSHGDKYDWNPCEPFTLNGCKNVSACHEIVSGTFRQYVPLGTQDTAAFVYDGDQLRLVYTDSTQNQKAVVKLVCDQGIHDDFTALGQDTSHTDVYNFQLKSKLACENPNSSSTSVSIGTMICIGFGVTLFIYVVSGVLIQIFVRKESGARVIPNYDFWIAVPIHIKSGVMFVARRGKTSTSYDAI